MAVTTYRMNYCVTLPAILKWLEIIIACVILALICWEVHYYYGHYRYMVNGEQFTIFVCCFVLILNFIFLLIISFSLYNQMFGGYNCLSIISLYYFICIILFFIAGGVEVYATIVYRDCRPDYNCEDPYGRRAAAAALCFLNGLLFISSLQHVRFHREVVFLSAI